MDEMYRGGWTPPDFLNWHSFTSQICNASCNSTLLTSQLKQSTIPPCHMCHLCERLYVSIMITGLDHIEILPMRTSCHLCERLYVSIMTNSGGVGQAHMHSASDDVMLSEIIRFWALQPLLNAFYAVFESSLPC